MHQAPGLPALQVIVLVLFLAPQLPAVKAEPAKVFRDHMVLQRGKPVAVFGTAASGAEVIVRFAGQTRTTIAADDRWKLHLDAMAANATGQDLVIEIASANGDTSTFTATNVLVGDVFFAGGQSNMANPVRNILNKQKLSLTNNKLIRFYKYPTLKSYNETPKSWDDSWTICGDNATQGISASAYFFAINLQPEIDVPLGVVISASGATPLESWMSSETLNSDPSFVPVLERKHDQQIKDSKQPTINYDQMIKPLLPCTVTGFIWYQGEGNTQGQPHVGAKEYRTLFPALIEQWRRDFEAPDAPFYFVQLASFGGYKEGDKTFGMGTSWPELREAQYLTLGLEHTGMVCCLDIGEENDIHPGTKQQVGERLALLARHGLYQHDVVPMGPIYTGCDIDSNRITLHFAYTGDGLAVRDGGELVGFEIAGADKQYVPASAKIVGDTVVVTGTANPKYVRYAWKNWPEYKGTIANLINTAGLPASSFESATPVTLPSLSRQAVQPASNRR